jgi:hypothetical protein
MVRFHVILPAFRSDWKNIGQGFGIYFMGIVWILQGNPPYFLQLFVLLWEDMRRENVSLSVERSGDRPTTGGQETVPQQAGKRGTGTS